MDALRRAADHIRGLEARVRELEALVKEKDDQLTRLSLEVPGGQRKLSRLGITSPATPQTAVVPAPGGGSEIKWPANKVRSTFISFFQSKGHTFWPSSPSVPVNDPTLMFANSGMNQFKPLFLGQADPTTEIAKLKRACNTQKCIRAGGKHNDLDDVGRDSYHHSYFEMLGNWSFGNYFKQDAIDWAWELLTKVYGINPERLYATYFRGNASVPEDIEARTIWLKYLPASRVLPFGEKENFWEMGPTGPCGPCTEIHYDRIGGRDAAALVNMDDPMCLEIWNLVFIQYNRNQDRSLDLLPSQHVDTGMGFERLTSVLQDKKSNYDTDIFTPLFNEIQKRSHGGPYQGRYGEDDTEFIDTAYRVVCDHLRALCHAIADGCEPDKSERGYVLRRILRRAVRHGKETLKADDYFFSSLVPFYADMVEGIFPEVKRKVDFVKAVIEGEERDFMRTIANGRLFFLETVKKSLANGEKQISGKDAFFMYSSLGFPYDLTEIMAREKGMSVDKAGFDEEMEKEKKRSEAAENNRGDGESAEGFVPKLDVFATDALEKKGIPATIAEPGKLAFDANPGCTAKILAIFDPRTQTFVDEALPGQTYGLIFDRTNFYHESGGQQADTGKISSDEQGGITFQVVDCQASKGFVCHAGVNRGTSPLKLNSSIVCLVDVERRKRLAMNHTTTHLLNFALRKVLKRDTDQKGSLVSPDKLRFDFDSRDPVNQEQLELVEQVVRQEISASKPVYTKVIPLSQAKSITTLRAVFGENYPDPVRVVSVGVPVDDLVAQPSNEQWMNASVELCGGSHMGQSSQAETFVLASEEGIAKGVRRIVGLTGEIARRAQALAQEYEMRVENLAGLANKSDRDSLKEASEVEKTIRLGLESVLISQVSKMKIKSKLEDIGKTIVKKQKETDKAQSGALKQRILDSIKGKNVNVVVSDVSPEEADVNSLGKVCKELAEKQGICAFLFLREAESFSGCATVPQSMTSALKADQWVAELQIGKGGGRATQASVRGPISSLQEAMDKAKAFAKNADASWVVA